MSATQKPDHPASHALPLLHHRVVLVTGASRGIGAATATLLAQHGAKVGVNYYHSQTAASELVDRIRSVGGEAVAFRADVRDQEQVDAMVQELELTLGPIDTLVLNASGVGHVTPGPLLDQPWDCIARDQLPAVFVPCKAVTPLMIQRKRGCIIAVGSGLSRWPKAGFGAISIAKAGVDALVRSLALELGPHGIRVNVVAPDVTLTDATRSVPQLYKDEVAARTPLRRNAVPADVAGAILLLAAEQTRFVTGAYIPANGGLQMI
jgi:3-oxoacyl-[acyl-carrier protein] reductase